MLEVSSSWIIWWLDVDLLFSLWPWCFAYGLFDVDAGGDNCKVYQLQIRHLQKPKSCMLSVVSGPRGKGWKQLVYLLASFSTWPDIALVFAFCFCSITGTGNILRLKLCGDEVESGPQHIAADVLQAATPGQIVAVYDGDVCLGGGPILSAYFSEHRSSAKYQDSIIWYHQ